MIDAYEQVPLGKLVSKVLKWKPADEAPDEFFDYVDISSINKETKTIEEPARVIGRDAPSRARQVLSAGDVLVSTVRPNLNGVAYVGDAYAGATASTGFCVLRPRPEKLDARYLYHWVQTTVFVSSLVKQATGASYPAVNNTIVKRETIPLLPLDEQRHIAAILDRADALRAKRRRAQAMLNVLLRSAFVEMFGDPVLNPKGWPMSPFGSVGTLDRGKSRHRPRNAPELLGGPYPLIQTGEVANSWLRIETFTETYSELGLEQSKMWPQGTLCITIAANIAETGILDFDACFPDSVVGFTPDDSVTSEYVQLWLSFLQKTIQATAPEVAQKNINLKILRSLELPVPPVELQEQFSKFVDRLVELKRRYENASGRDDSLYQALAQRAFRGELTELEMAV